MPYKKHLEELIQVFSSDCFAPKRVKGSTNYPIYRGKETNTTGKGQRSKSEFKFNLKQHRSTLTGCYSKDKCINPKKKVKD